MTVKEIESESATRLAFFTSHRQFDMVSFFVPNSEKTGKHLLID
jgi:hypothetical protein